MIARHVFQFSTRVILRFLSQIAAKALLEELGFNPRLSHPREDAFKAVDLWVGEEGVVQIKGAKPGETQKLQLAETGYIAFPVVEAEVGSGKTALINSELHHSFSDFKVKVNAYGKLLNKDLKGYFMVVPNSKIDFVTGEPNEELRAEARKKLVFDKV